MVVEILDDSEDVTATYAAPAAKTGFLKLYDWRFATQLRRDCGAELWPDETESEYTKFLLSGNADDFFEQIDGWDDTYGRQPEDGWDVAQDEAFLASEMLRMYRAETAVYARLSDFQGKLVPSLLSRVVLDAAPEDFVGDQHREHFQSKGILLQYVQGFSLDALDSLAPPASWQGIVDQAVHIVHVLGDNDILNTDVRPDNFIVSSRRDGMEPEGVGERGGYQVFMLDFGQSRVRRENQSDFDWGRAKWRQDEEGAAGLVMQHRLRKLGTAIIYEPSLRYVEFAECEENDD